MSAFRLKLSALITLISIVATASKLDAASVSGHRPAIHPPSKSKAASSYNSKKVPEADALVSKADALTSSDPQKASALYQQATVIYERQSGKHNVRLANILVKIASLLQSQNKFDQAETYLRTALATYEHVPTTPEKTVADAFMKLGLSYLSSSKAQSQKQAAITLQRALTLAEHCYGTDSAHAYKVLTLLDRYYEKEGNKDMEATVHQQAQDVLSRLPLKYEGNGTAAHSNFDNLLAQEEQKPKQ